MKKIIKICAVLLLLASCTKENDSLMTLKNSTAAISENKINAMMEDYSQVLSSALQNEEIRQIIREKAMVMFDGDYDVLVDDFHSISMNDGRSVLEYLRWIAESQYSGSHRHFEALNDIVDLIPNLQISIPVNIDTWNEAVTVPTVITVPCNYDDLPYAPSYLHSFSNGIADSVNVSREPSDAVIVVSVSERISRTGIRIADSIRAIRGAVINNAPLAPDNLSIHYTAPNSALLRWNDASNNEGYYIYATQNGIWRKIDSTERNENMYGISNLTSGETYTFAVRSKNSNGVSSFSHTAKIKATNRGDNNSLIIDSIYLTASKLNDIEPWFLGGPELMLNVYSSNANHDSTQFFNIIRIEPSRKSVKNSWYKCHMELTTSWSESPCTILLFAWDEVNERFNYSVSVRAQYAPDSLKVANGTLYVNAEATYNATSSHKEITRRYVSFWDPKRHVYQDGGFEFICTSSSI